MRFLASLFLVLLQPLFASRCMRQQQEEFRLEISSVSVQPGAGSSQELLYYDQEQGSFVLTSSSAGQSVTRKIDSANVATIIQVIKRDRIMKLQDRYADDHALDGATVTIDITLNGRRKEIKLRNTRPKELDNFFSSLAALYPR